MQVAQPNFKKYLFVCENKREDGACCADAGIKLRETLKEKIKAMGLSTKVRVSRTGCVDVCSEGPNVLLMPDNIWFKRVELSDVEKIIQAAVVSL